MPARILIYGVTGSGKTTYASRLAQKTGLPWHSIDDLTWDRDWVPVPVAEQRRRVAEICAHERWILDAAYGQWLDIPLARVELIIGLDFPRWVSLTRLLRRTAARIVDRRPICNGNRESLRTAFSRDSIIVWHFRSFRHKRARIRAWAGNNVGPEVRRFTSPRVLDDWLDGVALDR